MNEQKTVTLKEARFSIGCGEKFLRAEIARGAIKVRRVNARVILVDVNSLNEYMEVACIIGGSPKNDTRPPCPANTKV